jgi:archaellin
VFTTKIGSNAVTSLNANDQVEIYFGTAGVTANTKMTIELRPSVGAALPFTKTAPATITATNVLY